MYVISNIRESRERTELELVVSIPKEQYNAIDKAVLIVADKTLWKALKQAVERELEKAQDTLKSVQAL